MFIHITGLKRELAATHNKAFMWHRLASLRTLHQLATTSYVAIHLAKKGVSLAVTAAMLGHCSARMVDADYGHLSKNFANEQLWANMLSLK
jgi:integrase